MAHDVFVSYPTASKPTADAVVNRLENERVRCWVAPRDVAPGTDWAGSIINAIEDSQMVVLVFSDAANESKHILREVRQAADAGLPILPFRITDAPLSAALAYYLGDTHWLDALTNDLERHLDELSNTVSRLLSGQPSAEDVLSGVGPTARPMARARPSRRRRTVYLTVIGLIAIASAWIGSSVIGSDPTPTDAAGRSTTAVASPQTTNGELVTTTSQPGTTTTKSFASTSNPVFAVGDGVDPQHEALAREIIVDAVYAIEEMTGYSVPEFTVYLEADAEGLAQAQCEAIGGSPCQPYNWDTQTVGIDVGDIFARTNHAVWDNSGIAPRLQQHYVSLLQLHLAGITPRTAAKPGPSWLSAGQMIYFQNELNLGVLSPLTMSR